MAGNMFIGSDRIKKIYLSNSNSDLHQYKKGYVTDANGVPVRVYSAGNICTYVVSPTYSYQEEVDMGATCLNPSRKPTLSGYSFLGWREDTTASSTTLKTKDMGDEPVTLYAVFTKSFTLTLYNGKTTGSTSTHPMYINQNNTKYSNATLTLADVGGWSKVGWNTTANNGTKTHNNNASVSMNGNKTFYSLYSQTITCTAYSGSNSASTQNGTRITQFAERQYTFNPQFTLTESNLTGWSRAGWANASNSFSAVVSDGGKVTLASSATYYGLYSQNVTVTKYNQPNSSTTETKLRIANIGTYTVYSNPTFKLTNSNVPSGYVGIGWTKTPSQGVPYSDVVNGGSVELSSSTTYYARYSISRKAYFYNSSQPSTVTDDERMCCNSTQWFRDGASVRYAVLGVYNWNTLGWSLATAPNSTIKMGSNENDYILANTNYYAQYNRIVWVSYNANGGSGSMDSDGGTAYRNYVGTIRSAEVQLKNNAFTRYNYTFKGWNTSPQASQGISSYKYIGWENVTMYAIWKRIKLPLLEVAPNVGYWTSSCTTGSIQNFDGANDYTLKRVANGQTGAATFQLFVNTQNCDNLTLEVTDVHIPDSGSITITVGSSQKVLTSGQIGTYTFTNGEIANNTPITITTSNSSNDYWISIRRATSFYS